MKVHHSIELREQPSSRCSVTLTVRRLRSVSCPYTRSLRAFVGRGCQRCILDARHTLPAGVFKCRHTKSDEERDSFKYSNIFWYVIICYYVKARYCATPLVAKILDACSE